MESNDDPQSNRGVAQFDVEDGGMCAARSSTEFAATSKLLRIALEKQRNLHSQKGQNLGQKVLQACFIRSLRKCLIEMGGRPRKSNASSATNGCTKIAVKRHRRTRSVEQIPSKLTGDAKI